MEVGRGEVTLDWEAEGAVKKLSLSSYEELVGSVTYENDIDDTPKDRGDGASEDEPMRPGCGEVKILRAGQFYLFTVEHFMVRQDS